MDIVSVGSRVIARRDEVRSSGDITEHRIVKPPATATEQPGLAELARFELGPDYAATTGVAPAPGMGVGIGDKVVLPFSDDQKRISARLTEGSSDLEKGHLSFVSPLEKAILGAEEGDEVELPLENRLHLAGRPQVSTRPSA